MSERLADHLTTAPGQIVTSFDPDRARSGAILADPVNGADAGSRSRND